VKYTLIIILISLQGIALAQNSLSPQVIGSQGSVVSGSAGNSLQYTVGEAIIMTTQSSNHILTQGFNQPKTLLNNNPLNVLYTVTAANCFGIYNGAIVIDSIVGCEADYSIEFEGVLITFLEIDSLTAREYELTVTSSDGCVWSETITIPANGEDCELIFYNAFSPNDDGTNDVWEIGNAPAYPNNMVQLFDRWGNKVWSVEGYNNTERVWDGKNTKGVAMPNGTYFYIFQSGEAIYKGYVEITK
jgi:gliding motility-associated-like protein